MPLNINGYALSNSGGLKFGTTNTKIVRPYYGISDPALPGMCGESNTGAGAVKVYPFPVNTVSVNNGSPWSTSTYLFTAPVAGIYFVSYGGIIGEGAVAYGNGYFAVMVNGVTWYHTYKDTINLWELHHFEVLVKVAAGDTIGWAMNASPGPAVGSGGAYQSKHNACTIWLIG